MPSTRRQGLPGMAKKSPSENAEHMYRHACHALEDFITLRERQPEHRYRYDAELWNSLSHHLRHAVYRARQMVTHD